MRCVACERDSKKKDQKVPNMCPNCGHKFVLDPNTDGVTDGFMKRAVVAASSNGTFKYLPAQLDHEISRRSQTLTFKQRLSKRKLAFAIFIAGILCITYLALSDWEVGVIPYAIIVLITYKSARKFWGRATGSSGRPKNARTALRRYEKVNPDAAKIDPGSIDLNDGGKGDTFDRLLVCARPEYRDFYIANDFQLHHACHVLGPDDLETEEGRELFEILKKNPELDVFVVHDATPRGAKFADVVRSDQRWFDGAAGDKVLDLGMIADQLSLFESMLRPLTPVELWEVEPSVTGPLATMGADLSAIPAGPLMMLTGASVDERLTFDKNSYTEQKRKKKSSDRDVDEWWLYIGGDGE